ncbi:MAG: iron ABC transporter permease [Bacilli bacterium]|nr:iron ABC transporter permease [Bacilli bacterium]
MSDLKKGDLVEKYQINYKKKIITFFVIFILTILMFLISTFVGSSGMSFVDVLKAIFKIGDQTNQIIVWNIRLPRVIAAIICGAGLSLAGLVMQTNLNNQMASPSTLGVSQAAVFGANLIIIPLANSALGKNSYFITFFAFIFAMISILLILGLSSIRKFNPGTLVLAGIGLGMLFQALTTIIQYFSSDTQLSSAVFWTFGDLGRATYSEDLMMLIVVVLSLIIFMFFSNSYNAMLYGDDVATSLGVKVPLVRFISLFLASLITATCISILGIIGFIGIIAPHIMKRTIGYNHKSLIPTSAIFGSLVLLIADTISRIIVPGTSLPVGAITSILGVPLFIYVIFAKKEGGKSQ